MAENTLVDKILALQDKYESLQKQLADPEVIADMKRYVQLNKDYKELEPIIKAGLEYKKMVDELAEAKDIMINEKDEDLRDMAKAEIAEIEPKIPEMEEQIKRSAAAQVVTRPPSSRETFSGCTPSTPRSAAGSWRSMMRPRVQLVATSRLSSSFLPTMRVSMES